MIKKNIFTLIMISLCLSNAIAQNIIEIYWGGYKVEPESSDLAGIENEKKYNSIFRDRLLELDKDNNYIKYIQNYNIQGSAVNPHTDNEVIFEILGEIKQYNNRGSNYSIVTKFPKTTIFFEIFDSFVDISKVPINSIIERHAEKIYDQIYRRFTLLSDVENLQSSLENFDKKYMQMINSLNMEESIQLIQELIILEENFGKSEEITNRRNGIARNAVSAYFCLAEENIGRAFDKITPNDVSERFVKIAEVITKQISYVIGLSDDPDIHERLEKVEKRIYEFWEKTKFAVNTGGLELFFEKPFLMLLTSSANFNLQEAYPDIMGVNLRYIIPLDLPIQWYMQLSYAGINGAMKNQNVSYINDAGIHFFSLSGGMYLQFFVNRIIAPYGFYGVGYIHLIEYASDDNDSVILNFPGMVTDVGVGLKFHLNQYFALNAMAQWNLILTEALIMDVKVSLGVSYMFYGKEYIIRR